ncbi:phage regulatory protein/antirepressor Ant [Clostridium felsineum]|nr:phage regulatory protein/antirepressor Ant [Clostridium felsineum]
MNKIRRELETLKSLGLHSALNFKVAKYLDEQGKSRECFELTRDGMLQMLNSESAYVRYKTIEYINKLEEKIKHPKDSYLIEDPIVRAKAWIKEQEEKQTLSLANKQKDQLIGELKPKADYTDTILKNKGLVTISQISKDYGMSGAEMNKLLHKLKIQYKQSNQWLLYSKYQAKGYTHSKTVDFKHSDGRPDIKMNTAWTQKGRLFLYELLKSNGILPVIEQRLE